MNQFKYESYKVEFTLPQRQSNLRIFLNATIVLNLAGCYTTIFFKKAARFTIICFHWGCIPSLHFMPLPLKVPLRCPPTLLITSMLIVKLTI